MTNLNNNIRSRTAIHACVETHTGLATLRDLAPEDIDAIVHYWYLSGDEHLDFLGIDRSLLGTKQDTRQRFLRAIPTGEPDRQTMAFAITVNGEFAGYTLLNRYTPEINYSHWHITAPELRGRGISSALYPYRIGTYFDLTPIARLIHQTRTRNIAVNRMLDRYVPVAEIVHIDKPDGVALPGEFHIRYVSREDIPRLFQAVLR